MENYSRRKRYNLISLITFSVIAITFGYYYFYLVNSRETKFNAKAFNAIENIGDNVEKKYENYYKNVSNALLHISKYEGGIGKGENDSLQNCFKHYHVPEELKVIKFGNSKSWRIQNIKKKLLSGTSGDEIVMVIDTVISDSIIVCKFASTELLKNTLRKDFFKKFIVISQKTIEGESGSKDYHLDIIHTDIPLIINHLVDHNSLDTTMFSKGALSSTRLTSVNYNNNDHKLYITPVEMGNGTTLFIGGIVEKDVFRKSTFGLDPVSMFIVIALLILLILSLPFQKLYLLSGDERLYTKDAVFSFMSVVVGSAFIFMLLLNWQSQNIASEELKGNTLRNYTLNIEKVFNEEIKKSLTLLDELDKLSIKWNTSINPINNSDTSHTTKVKPEVISDIPELNKIKIAQFTQAPSFQYDMKIENYKGEGELTVFWINEKGDQLVKWRTITNTPRTNLRTRPYFHKIINGNTWALNDSSIYKDFYMQSIFSWADGHNYMMFSKKSKNTNTYTKLPPKFISDIKKKGNEPSLLTPKVVVLAKNLSSLKKLPLPSNTSYMLIDQKGEVLYHETESKTLQENLLAETGYDKELSGALQSHSQTSFNAKYDGIKRSFYMKPLGDLPIFLVTYMDIDHERIINVQVISLTGMLYLLFLIILIVQIGVFVIINYKSKTKIEGRNLMFCWFWPDSRKQKVYLVLSFYLVISMVIYLSFSLYSNIFISLSYFSLLSAFVIFVLKRYQETCDSIHNSRNLIYFAFILGFSILLILNSGVSEWLFDILPGYICFILLSILFSILIKKQSVIGEIFPEKAIIRSYNLFVYLLVISLGLVPVIGFYSKSFTLEKELNIRSMQLDLVKKLADIPSDKYYKQCELADIINSHIININTDSIENRKIDSIYKADISGKSTKILSKSEKRLINKLRFTHSEKNYNQVSFDFLENDSIWRYHWQKSKDTIILNDVKNGIKLISESERFSVFRAGFRGFFLIFISFIICCFVFFKFIQYWTEKIFLLGLPHKKEKNEFKLVLKSFKFVYIVSLPHSGVKRYLNNNVERVHSILIEECDQADFIKEQLSKIKSNLCENIVLYDSNSYTEKLLEAKTKLINDLIKLMNEKHSLVKKVILVSNMLPSYKVNKILENETNSNLRLKHYFSVMGNFKQVYYSYSVEPLTWESNRELIHLFNECDREDADQWTNWEAEFSPKNENGEVEEAGILNIQSLSQIQYASIWKSLEEREQFVIFDLAEDGLVNYKNICAIDSLINKGLLDYENLRLRPFNESFRNFVLTYIDREESLRIESESKRLGNWSNLQLPIIMVIFTLSAFLFVTQQDIFNDIFAWMGTALISLPLLLRVVTSLSIGKIVAGKS